MKIKLIERSTNIKQEQNKTKMHFTFGIYFQGQNGCFKKYFFRKQDQKQDQFVLGHQKTLEKQG